MQADELCFTSLPRKIKLGPYDWSVHLKNPEDSKTPLCGQTHFDTLQFWIFPDHLHSPALVVGVVLHEALHVMFENHGIAQAFQKRKKEDREEAIVLGFEAGLISLFRDNPKLLTWMKKWLK